MKNYIIGDIHGRIEALKQVFQKSKFNYKKDILIVLGDVVDGGYNTNKVIDELLKIKNLIFIIGNHDYWKIQFLFKGKISNEWVNQGGANTLNSYGAHVTPSSTISKKPIMLDINGAKVPKTHVEFFKKGLYYFEFDDMLFVHGGFDPKKPINKQDPKLLMWDRDLIKYADDNNISNYKKVFIGHTSTQTIERNWINFKCRNCNNEWEKKVLKYHDMVDDIVCDKCKSTNIFQSLGCTKPLKIGNLFCLDTGAGWDGKLTLMNIYNNEEFYQSSLQKPPIMSNY